MGRWICLPKVSLKLNHVLPCFPGSFHGTFVVPLVVKHPANVKCSLIDAWFLWEYFALYKRYGSLRQSAQRADALSDEVQVYSLIPAVTEEQQRRVYFEKQLRESFTIAETENVANHLEDHVAARKRSSDNATHVRRKRDELRSSSSLSPASQLASPKEAPANVHPPGLSPSTSSSSTDTRQPQSAVSVAQYQTFGPDPSTFDDPTIYHIREVKDDMTEEEKREIYCVNSFPKSDLSHLIAGTLPDKDFSNAKPTNQVNANTFAAYIDPYVRPLTEEDMAWLKERVSGKSPSKHCLWFHAYKGSRVTVWGHLVCPLGGKSSTKTSGPKKTAKFQWRPAIKASDYLRTNHVVVLKTWTMM